MLPLMLILSAAPQLTVTTKDVRVDGKVVLSPIPDGSEPLPALKTALVASKEPNVRLEFAPGVPFKLAKRVLMTLAAAGKRRPEAFFVGAKGPFPLNQDDSEATVINVNPGGEPFAALALHLASKAPKQQVIAFNVADAVTMERLSEWLTTFQKEGFTRHELDAADGLGAEPPEATAPLTQTEVAKIVELNRDDLDECYQRALRQTPTLAGEVRLKFVVGKNGRVTEISVSKDTTGSRTLAPCLVAAAKAFVFPKNSSGLSVEYPLVFTGK